jgi:hypothetical protein
MMDIDRFTVERAEYTVTRSSAPTSDYWRAVIINNRESGCVELLKVFSSSATTCPSMQEMADWLRPSFPR